LLHTNNQNERVAAFAHNIATKQANQAHSQVQGQTENEQGTRSNESTDNRWLKTEANGTSVRMSTRKNTFAGATLHKPIINSTERE
jgi:hypothetical protein